MAERDNPKCFIAMAFDREDTDSLYEKQILPVLKRNHITPVIINRRQSNDDLNVQIIEQIEHADFCITDLIYARPSVYFEAGYAQRSIVVIYTVRSDHVKLGQPDNLRVHFDLQMKPLVRWKNPDDSSFSANLELRIKNTFLKGWEHERQHEAAAQEAISQFEGVPVSTRLINLRKAMILALRRNGCIVSSWHSLRFFPFQTRIDDRNYVEVRLKEPILEGIVTTSASLRLHDNVLSFYTVRAYMSITKSELKNLARAYSPASLDRIFTGNHYSKVDTISLHHFVLDLKVISSNRIESVLTSVKPIEKGKCYCGEWDYHSFYTDIRRRYISTWHFITGIRSEPQLKEAIKDQLLNYLSMQEK